MRKVLNGFARWLYIATDLSGDIEHSALHNLHIKVQNLKRENSRLSIQNTILKTKLFTVKL